jgi:hypothetical protein
MNKVIISVHVAKTAGTSFAVWLESVFGSGQIVRDNADRPIDPKSEMNVDPAGFLSRDGSARKLPREPWPCMATSGRKNTSGLRTPSVSRFYVILSNV